MKTSLSCIFWLQIFCVLGVGSMDSRVSTIKKKSGKHEHLNILLEDLQNQEWSNDEAPCVDLLLKIIRNVQNSTVWATWIWDSMQNPVGQFYGSKNYFGNYDQCLDFPWQKEYPDMKTQYCLAHIKLSDVDLQMNEVNLFGNVSTYIRAKTKYHLKFNTLNWGVCTPVTCSSHSVAKFVSVMFSHTYLGLSVDQPHVTVDQCDQVGDEEVSHSLLYYLSTCFLTFAVLFTIMATHIVSSHDIDRTSAGFFNAFHIPTNINNLMKVTKNDLRSLFVLKAMSCCVVASFHVFLTMNSRNVNNALILDKDYDIFTSVASTLVMVVETFLFMSGILFIKGLMAEDLEKNNPMKVIVKRYIRITWITFIVLLFSSVLFEDLPRGPAMKVELGREIDFCYKNWWANLLMIQNYYDTKNICHPVVWSLAVDFHLSILATMLYWVYLRSRKSGISLFLIASVISIAIPAALVYSDYERFRPFTIDFRVMDDFRKIFFQSETYLATHFRAGSYLVGIAVGYFIYQYNPITHRNIINQKHSLFGFGVVLTMFLGFIVTTHKMIRGDFTIIGVASYVALSRIIWALWIGILVMICEYGRLPLVDKFLSWTVWAPISKLTPGIYLVHTIFCFYFLGATRNARQYGLIDLVFNTIGIIVFSSITSLFLWIFFEAPMANILSLLFRSESKRERHEIFTKVNDDDSNNFEDISNKKKK